MYFLYMRTASNTSKTQATTPPTAIPAISPPFTPEDGLGLLAPEEDEPRLLELVDFAAGLLLEK